MSDENDQNTNRRSEDREQVEGKARVQVLDAPYPELKNTQLDADLFDVSASGLRIACSELLDECSLEIEATLTGASDSVSIRGDVLWASFEEDGSFQMGVEIKGNDEAAIDSWHNLLESTGNK